jgi:hypothetical protein
LIQFGVRDVPLSKTFTAARSEPSAKSLRRPTRTAERALREKRKNNAADLKRRRESQKPIVEPPHLIRW